MTISGFGPGALRDGLRKGWKEYKEALVSSHPCCPCQLFHPSVARNQHALMMHVLLFLSFATASELQVQLRRCMLRHLLWMRNDREQLLGYFRSI
jgi:hypothetical protein